MKGESIAPPKKVNFSDAAAGTRFRHVLWLKVHAKKKNRLKRESRARGGSDVRQINTTDAVGNSLVDRTTNIGAGKTVPPRYVASGEPSHNPTRHCSFVSG